MALNQTTSSPLSPEDAALRAKGPPVAGSTFVPSHIQRANEHMGGNQFVKGYWTDPSVTGGGGFLGQVADSVSGGLQHISDVVSNDPIAKTVAAVGLAVVTGGASSALSASLLESGIVSSAAVADAAAAAIVNTGVQTALGVPFDKAAGNAILNFAGNQLITPAISAEVKTLISNPTVANMATSAGNSIVTGVLRGQSGDEIAKSAIGSATGVLAGSVGKDVGDKVLSSIDDPTIAKIASDAASAGTTALIKGQDAGKAALEAGATTLSKSDLGLGDSLSGLTSGLPSVDTSGLKAALQPISDVATKFAQPISDVATKALQPVEGAIKGAAQGASDVATKVLQPAEGAIKGAAQKASDVVTSATEPLRQGFQSASDALTSATKPVSDTLSSAGDTIKSAGSDSFDKSVIDMMNKAPTANQPAVSNVATGGEGSAAAYGGADVAMLGDTSQAGLGSKVSKKGGKYPWGEPEGTSALKEGLGV